MGVKGRSTEELFLGIFKGIMLAVLGLSLLASAGALVFAAYEYLQSPEAVEPAKKVDDKAINSSDFLQQINAAPKVEAKNEGDGEGAAAGVAAADTKSRAEPMKYREEARKMIACARELASKSGLDGPNYSDESEESFRSALQHAADDSGKDRGLPYVGDALKVVCALLGHEQVLAYRKANAHEDILGRIVSFHVKAWDRMKEEVHKFEREEEARVKEAREREDLRIVQARATAYASLVAAGVAFGVFLVAALYLLMGAVESNLRYINRNLAAIRASQPAMQRSAASRY